jgi:predicted permease
MDAVLNVGVPVFAIILAGYLSGRAGVLGSDSTRALNAFVYYFALPPVLFLAMIRVPLDQVFNWPFIAVYTGGVLFTFVLSAVASLTLFPHGLAALTVAGKTAIFSNTGYMGIPLFLAAFGDQGLLPAVIATVYNGALVVGIAIVMIELDQRQHDGLLVILRDILIALLTNPLVMSAVLGILWALTGLALPRPLVNLGELLGAAAGPCALFAMGLFLVGRQASADMQEVAWLVLLKLIVQPLVTWWLAFKVMNLEAGWAASAVILAALPTGALTFVVAERYNVFVQGATAATLISTVLSVATVSFLLAYFGLG